MSQDSGGSSSNSSRKVISMSMDTVMVAPSILAADLANLCSVVSRTEEAGADMIHLDVIDGHFAPNITFGPDTIRALRRCTSLPFDTHLMISEPLRYLERFIKAGCDIVTVHVEVCNAGIFRDVCSMLKGNGVGIGIALNPDTDIPSWAMDSMHDVDLINVMSVYPGFPGQRFIPSTLDKIARISNMLRERGFKARIEADGGVDATNVYNVASAGARVIVAGNGVYGNSDIASAIRSIRERAMLAVAGSTSMDKEGW
ncbi:MAG: ribulose-phosphate 3-epimerase [Candidatus Nitrosocaldus sp.]|nr:ribulose-phosphate 3-epimerase [Candidatus Nitrosocaldus sp.]MDW7999996.1 ribulose-phosphate 3-epimerase [Candidatus Nitrosocaldus sp.]